MSFIRGACHSANTIPIGFVRHRRKGRMACPSRYRYGNRPVQCSHASRTTTTTTSGTLSNTTNAATTTRNLVGRRQIGSSPGKSNPSSVPTNTPTTNTTSNSSSTSWTNSSTTTPPKTSIVDPGGVTSTTSVTTKIPPNVVPKSFAIGTVAGICGSLAGMGGGFIMIPLLTTRTNPRWLSVGLTQHQAHGTSLFAVTTTGMAGAIGYQYSGGSGGDHNTNIDDDDDDDGIVDYEAAAAIAICGMVTARWGASVTTVLSEQTLKKALGVFLLLVAPLPSVKQYIVSRNTTTTTTTLPSLPPSKQQSITRNDDDDHRSWEQRILLPCCIGTCSGFMAGLFGVGGGT
jgi:hypothetical protein